MTFNLPTILILAALGGSVAMLAQARDRVVAIVAVIASVIELLFTLHILTLSIRGVSLWLLLGGVLVVCGVIVWARNGAKSVVTSATVVTVVGGIQVFTALVH